MITDGTILEKLRWQEFGDRGSYNVAVEKYNDILAYVFPGLDTTNFRVQKDGIQIKTWSKDNCCFRGINLNFYDNFERKTCFRLVEFKGAAKDFKAKVLKKFEALKLLREASDNQTAIEGSRRIAEAVEIGELTSIAKRAFNKYEVEISKEESGYRLSLEIDFNDKTRLVGFCNEENL